jgi:hypothetical protein
MTLPKHLVCFRIIFGANLPERQVENMCPTLAGYGPLFEEAPRSFKLQTQVEGKRKSVIKILMDWETLGLVRWEELP